MQVTAQRFALPFCAMKTLTFYLDVLRLWLLMVSIVALLLLIFAPKVLLAQELPAAGRSPQAVLTLPQVIDLTLVQSAVAKQAHTNRETSYWQYRSFRADYKPLLSVDGVLPNYSRTILAV